MSSPVERNPFMFVVGCPRSGTTLLQRMLDAHPQLALANDTHFIPRTIEKVLPAALRDPLLAARPEAARALIEFARSYRRFKRLELPDAVVQDAAAASATYVEFVSALYTAYARLRGKPLGGEKTPDYVKHVRLLHALFPGARTLHIIRDGRDVALSTLQWANAERGPGKLELWREEPVAVAALWWRWQVSTGRRDGAALAPDRYREVRYEHLVQQPTVVLREIAEFVQLPFAPEMAAFSAGKEQHAPELSAKKAWRPATPGLRSWRDQMDGRSQELFEALAGDLLAELGYERGFQSISPPIAAVAEKCRQWWTELRSRRESRLAQRAEATREVGSS